MAEITHIPEDVRHELRADETPQWIGYPIPKQYAIQEGLTLFLFGIPWTAFVIFWESQAMKSGNLFFQLGGIPFILVGLYLLANPLLEYWRALRTAYAVTNQRLLILNGLLQPSVESYVPPFDIKRKERRDGTGTIIFARKEKKGGKGGSYSEDIGFFAVPNVREVEESIIRLQDEYV